MSEIDHINVFEDRAFLQRVVRWSAVVVCAGIAAVVVWVAAVGAINRQLGLAFHVVELFWLDAFWPWGLSLVVAVLLALVAHELVHGFFFRQFAPPGAHVTYGFNWKRGMAYACAEGIVYSRAHYEVIILAPTVVVTGALAAIGIGLGWPIWTITVVVAHLSGCTGDWGYLAALRRDPRILWCEDTSWGVRFYGEDAPGAAAGLHVLDGRGSGAGAGKAAATGAAGAAGEEAGAGAASAVGGASKAAGADEAGGAKGAPASVVGATGVMPHGPEGACAPGGLVDGVAGGVAGGADSGARADELAGAMSEDGPADAVGGAADAAGGTAKVPSARGNAGAVGAPAAVGAAPRGLGDAGLAGAKLGAGLGATGAAPAVEGAPGAEPAEPGAAPASGKPAEEPPARPVFVLVSGGVRGAGAPREPEPAPQVSTAGPRASAPEPESLPQDPAAGE